MTRIRPHTCLCRLTFDVRGGLRLAARRPLDGAVRAHGLASACTMHVIQPTCLGVDAAKPLVQV
jgi:hypothetical protein